MMTKVKRITYLLKTLSTYYFFWMLLSSLQHLPLSSRCEDVKCSLAGSQQHTDRWLCADELKHLSSPTHFKWMRNIFLRGFLTLSWSFNSSQSLEAVIGWWRKTISHIINHLSRLDSQRDLQCKKQNMNLFFLRMLSIYQFLITINIHQEK